jgi:hypothetical protein
VRGACLTTLVAAAAATVVLGAPQPAVAAETGVNIALNQTVDGPAKAARLRAGWVRLFAGWAEAEPERGRFDAFYLDRIRAEVASFRARGVKPLVVLSGTPPWAAGPQGPGLAGPRDPQDYGRFAGELVRRVPGIGAIELWNEADSPAFWAGGPDPGAYAALLRATYPAVKAADPAVIVVSTGMVGNHFGFLEDLYAAGAGGAFDAVGVHTDTACLLASPRAFYREPDGRVGRFSFTGYREVHAVMAAHGDGGKGIWMTEIGWNTGSRRPRSCRDGAVAGTRAEGVGERTQARFLTLAYRCIAADPYVHVALWFSLQDVGHGAGYGDHLGLIRRSGRHKPAFRALRAVANGRGARPAGCGAFSDRLAPALSVLAPTEGAVLTSDENLPVRVRSRDNAGGTGVRRVELHVDGRLVRVWGGARVTGSWFGFRRLGYGAHRVVVQALDRAHNRAAQAFTVHKVTPGSLGDRARPLVRWRSAPRSGGRAVRIAVDVSDRGPAGLRKATLYLDGRRVRTRRRGGLWRTRLSLAGLARGRHKLTVRAEDRAGNVAYGRRTFVRR